MTIPTPCLFQLLEAFHILWLLVSPRFTPSSKLPVAGSLTSHLTSSIVTHPLDAPLLPPFPSILVVTGGPSK